MRAAAEPQQYACSIKNIHSRARGFARTALVLRRLWRDYEQLVANFLISEWQRKLIQMHIGEFFRPSNKKTTSAVRETTGTKRARAHRRELTQRGHTPNALYFSQAYSVCGKHGILECVLIIIRCVSKGTEKSSRHRNYLMVNARFCSMTKIFMLWNTQTYKKLTTLALKNSDVCSSTHCKFSGKNAFYFKVGSASEIHSLGF
jgi:hypothetical protein